MDKKIEHVRRRKIDIKNVEKIEPKYVSLSSKVMLERTEYKNLSADAKRYAAQDKKEKKLQKLLDAANQVILKLEKKVAELTAELAEYRSVRGKLRIGELQKENGELREKMRRYEGVIGQNNLWHLFEWRRDRIINWEEKR